MAKIRAGSSKKKNGIIKLKFVAKKLQESLSLGKRTQIPYREEFEEVNDSRGVPEDVKEGHFAVIADGEEPKRFVVPLSYLTHPMFLRLLEQAAEEYGFDHEGALTIPCRPSELEKILADRQCQEEGEAGAHDEHVNWSSRQTIVQSY
ncbi:hypothetical protein Tsubulata_007485 [Turnera subulata]|uniref:Uncharacterized protein n=1 Tax=Turnera subulata TaxID=218843 RepID=A0A9Q0FFB5_9ROSI|nr:hypothetical protein Tsubulata_007485 [Turnera subulata]